MMAKYSTYSVFLSLSHTVSLSLIHSLPFARLTEFLKYSYLYFVYMNNNDDEMRRERERKEEIGVLERI
jgi:hypothetical protein